MKFEISERAALRVVNSMLKAADVGVTIKALPSSEKVELKKVYSVKKNKDLLYYYSLKERDKIYKSPLTNKNGLETALNKCSRLDRAIFHKCVKVVPVVSSKGIHQLSSTKTKN